jgi:hypothetical protein
MELDSKLLTAFVLTKNVKMRHPKPEICLHPKIVKLETQNSKLKTQNLKLL